MPELLGVSIPSPIDPVGGLVSRAASETSGAIVTAAGRAVAHGLSDACGQVTDGLVKFLSSSAGISFSSGWWASARTQTLLRTVAALAAALMVVFVLLALLQGLVAGDPGAMVRSVLAEVPMSVLGTVALVAVAKVLVAVTDQASAAVLAGAPRDLGRFLSGFGAAASAGTGGLAAVVILVVFLLAALAVWVELIVRASLIYLLVAAAPLLLAARVWPAARGAFRRLCELGVALIVAKFGIALALALGASALAGGGPGDGVAAGAGLDLAGLLGGACLMLLAAFTPFVVLRLLPLVETATVAHGISRSPARAAQSGMQASYYAQGLRRLSGGAARTGGGATGGGPGNGDSGGDGPGPSTPNTPRPSLGPAAGGVGASASAGAARGAVATGPAAPVTVPVGVAAAGAGAGIARARHTAGHATVIPAASSPEREAADRQESR